MYSNDVQWLSQNIFSHRDREYGTDGYMRVSMSTNTKDSQSFSAPTFTINIQNGGLNKTASLSYQKLFEIYSRLQEVVQAAGQEYSTKDGSPDAQLHYKTGKSAFITFEFLRGSQQNEPVVRISISHGTSDSTKIILPFNPEFYSFISLIGDMIKNRKYLDWCLHFPNRFFMIEVNNVMKQIPGLVKSAVVQMDRLAPEETPPTQSREPDPEPEPSNVDKGNIQTASDTMKELDAFVGEGMQNIDIQIPGEDKIKETKPETRDVADNKAIKWLGGDVRNFENIVMRCSEKDNPIRELEKEICENYSDMECFPGIELKEMKSIAYLIAREYNILNSQANSGPIKRAFSINKYNGQKYAQPINLELAYDLLVLTTFIKLCRDKIEEKTSDNYVNKTMVYLSTALNVSPFIYSFLSTGTELPSIVKERYRQMADAGMFDSYKDKEFKTYGFEITERDVIDSIDAFTEGYFGSKSYHVDSFMRHVSLFESQSCLLSVDNPVNEEQIINQVVPFEMYIISANKDLDADKKSILKYAKELGVDDEVVALFVKTAPTKNIPIVKFFENHLAEIPEEIRRDFMLSIMEYNEKDYDLSDDKFPYDSFGEEAVKALFLWKPETGEKFKTYKKFIRAVVASTHDKQTILSMITHDEDVSGETFADFYSSATGKGK